MTDADHHAIVHYKRTGVILPGEADRVARWLADRRNECAWPNCPRNREPGRANCWKHEPDGAARTLRGP